MNRTRWLVHGETIDRPLAYACERSARRMLMALQECGHICEMEPQQLVNGQWVWSSLLHKESRLDPQSQ